MLSKGNLIYSLKYLLFISCNKVLEIDPKYTKAWNNKGMTLYYLSKY